MTSAFDRKFYFEKYVLFLVLELISMYGIFPDLSRQKPIH